MAACQGFTTYAYVYVQRDADRIADEDIQAANAIRARARRLYVARRAARRAERAVRRAARASAAVY